MYILFCLELCQKLFSFWESHITNSSYFGFVSPFILLYGITLSINSVLVSYGCCNILPQTRRLKHHNFYYLPVLEVISLKWVSLGQNQVVGTVALLEEVLGANVSLLFSVSGGCLHPLACDLSLTLLHSLASITTST